MIFNATPAEQRREKEMIEQVKRRKAYAPPPAPKPREDGLIIYDVWLLPEEHAEPLQAALVRLDEVLGRADKLRADIAEKGKAIVTASIADEKKLTKEIAVLCSELENLPELAYFHYQSAAGAWFAAARTAVSSARSRAAELEANPPECMAQVAELNAQWIALSNERDIAEKQRDPRYPAISERNVAEMAELARQMHQLRPACEAYQRQVKRLQQVPTLVDMATK